MFDEVKISVIGIGFLELAEDVRYLAMLLPVVFFLFFFFGFGLRNARCFSDPRFCLLRSTFLRSEVGFDCPLINVEWPVGARWLSLLEVQRTRSWLLELADYLLVG